LQQQFAVGDRAFPGAVSHIWKSLNYHLHRLLMRGWSLFSTAAFRPGFLYLQLRLCYWSTSPGD